MQASIAGYLIAVGSCLIATITYIKLKKDVDLEKVKSFIDNYYLALFSIIVVLFTGLTIFYGK